MFDLQCFKLARRPLDEEDLAADAKANRLPLPCHLEGPTRHRIDISLRLPHVGSKERERLSVILSLGFPTFEISQDFLKSFNIVLLNSKLMQAM